MRSWLFLLAIFGALPALAQPVPDGGAPAPSPPSLAALPMDGPYATLADLCRAERGGAGDFDPAVCAAPPRTCGTAGHATARLAPPFIEARVIQWPGACDFVFRTDAGWWVPAWERQHPLARFLHNGERYNSEIDEITSTSDGVLVVRGTFIHWTYPGKMAWLKHPRYDSWYECEQRVVVCAMGAAGSASCTPPVATGYTTYCRAEDPPQRALHHPLAGVDYRWAAQITRNEIRLTGAPHPPDGPLPGWFVVAVDAEQRRDERRSLAPPRLQLHFP
jgi:hypothetical protein